MDNRTFLPHSRSRLIHAPLNGRGEVIRTLDPLHPMQVRYQAAPRPDRETYDRMISEEPDYT